MREANHRARRPRMLSLCPDHHEGFVMAMRPPGQADWAEMIRERLDRMSGARDPGQSPADA